MKRNIIISNCEDCPCAEFNSECETFCTRLNKMVDAEGIDSACPLLASQDIMDSANKQVVAALWRALSDKDVHTRSNSKGVWLPLTKKRLNAAYTKVFSKE
jgi:hypothetical protein